MKYNYIFQTDDVKKTLTINWSDNHSSTFELNWLKERNFSQANREKYLKDWYRPETIPWSKNEFNTILKKFDYKDVMEKDDGKLK